MPKKILRWPAVEQKTGICQSNIQKKIRRGEFPASISLGERAVGFLESDIDEWIESRIQASGKMPNTRTKTRSAHE